MCPIKCIGLGSLPSQPCSSPYGRFQQCSKVFNERLRRLLLRAAHLELLHRILDSFLDALFLYESTRHLFLNGCIQLQGLPRLSLPQPAFGHVLHCQSGHIVVASGQYLTRYVVCFVELPGKEKTVCSFDKHVCFKLSFRVNCVCCIERIKSFVASFEPNETTPF